MLNLPLDELYKERYNENVAALSFPVIMNSDKFFYPCINWKIKFKNTLHHQGTFYRRNIDHYDITYRVFADADLNKSVNMLLRHILFHISLIIYGMAYQQKRKIGMNGI